MTPAKALALLALALTFLVARPDRGATQEAAATGPTPDATQACREQSPQDFLVRGNWRAHGRASAEERAAKRALHRRAIQYRSQRYGYFPGFGDPSDNPRSPMENAAPLEAFGLRVRLNRSIHPAVRCAEAEIRATCQDTPYQPRRLSGIRDRNTYHNGEVSNHVYGIALDIDPDRNSCCGCVAPWPDHPLCQRRVDSIYERMAMPACWVHAFEKYGFYWLGHDTLQDTMHFEFLGEPERILRD